MIGRVHLSENHLIRELRIAGRSFRSLKDKILCRTPAVTKSSHGNLVQLQRRFCILLYPFRRDCVGAEWLPKEGLDAFPVNNSVSVFLEPRGSHPARENDAPSGHSFSGERLCVCFSCHKKCFSHSLSLEVAPPLFVAVNPDAVDEVQVGALNK